MRYRWLTEEEALRFFPASESTRLLTKRSERYTPDEWATRLRFLAEAPNCSPSRARRYRAAAAAMEIKP